MRSMTKDNLGMKNKLIKIPTRKRIKLDQRTSNLFDSESVTLNKVFAAIMRFIRWVSRSALRNLFTNASALMKPLGFLRSLNDRFNCLTLLCEFSSVCRFFRWANIDTCLAGNLLGTAYLKRKMEILIKNGRFSVCVKWFLFWYFENSVIRN